jgi:integrase
MGHRKIQNPKVDRRRGGANALYFEADALKAIEPGETRSVWLDTLTEGLQLIVYPTGRKSFHHRRKTGYASRRIHLGDFPGMSVSKARKKAGDLNGQYSRGEDPGEARHKVRKELTVSELYTLWLTEHMKPHRRASSVANAEQLWRDYLSPTLASRKLSAVTRGAVATLHGKIGLTRPTRANRALEVLSSMFSFALARELAPDAWNGANPCSRVKAFPETPRKRFLGHDELPRFLTALEAEPNADLRDFFTVLLLTGARRANVQSMKWRDIDLVSGTWSVAAEEAKGGEEMKLALTTEAVELLKRRKAEADELVRRVDARRLAPVPKMTLQQAKRWRNEARKAANVALYVFPGWGKTGHLAEPKSAWARLLERAGIAELRIHDLRRTVGAWLAAGGANVFQIKAALGHKSLAAAGVYAQLEIGGVRTELEKVEAAMREVAKNAREDAATQAAKVAPIKRENAPRKRATAGGAR